MNFIDPDGLVLQGIYAFFIVHAYRFNSIGISLVDALGPTTPTTTLGIIKNIAPATNYMLWTSLTTLNQTLYSSTDYAINYLPHDIINLIDYVGTEIMEDIIELIWPEQIPVVNDSVFYWENDCDQ
jgi:hypothetical protein